LDNRYKTVESERGEISEEEWREEVRWLAYVKKVLADRLADLERVVGNYKGQVKKDRRLMWQDAPHFVRTWDDVVKLTEANIHLQVSEQNVIFYHRMLQRLRRMEEAPYFGRIDFRERESSEVERIYVGLASLHEEPSGQIVVHDWRAPICSLFYDAEIGPAEFKSAAAVVEGEVLLKRQYRIEQGEMKFMFDTNLKIDDEVLQELLARSTGRHMRTIITSIQREQNRIIRNEEHNLVLVEGPAGSGKTAIALHRAAYLLYRFRDTITAENIVIFSPNRVFSDYISTVLPALGEENIMQTTFPEFAQASLGQELVVEDMADQLEYLYSGGEGRGGRNYWARLGSIRYKSTAAFLRVIKRYVRYLDEGNEIDFTAIYHRGQEIVSEAELRRLFYESYKAMPLGRRLHKIEQRVLYLLAPVEEARLKEWQEKLSANPDMFDWEVRYESRARTREEFRETKERIATWAGFNVVEAYKNLFGKEELFRQMAAAEGVEVPAADEWENIRRLTLAQLNAGRVFYEDAAPLLLMFRLLTGKPVYPQVRHVIIDESQDYSATQFELLGLTFPAADMTVLGDRNQVVQPYVGEQPSGEVTNYIRRRRSITLRLTRTYRSTKEIAYFTASLLPARRGGAGAGAEAAGSGAGMENEMTVETVARGGVPPVIVVARDEKRMVAALSRDVADFHNRGRQTIAVICHTAGQAQKVYRQLKQLLPEVGLIRKDDRQFRPGILVLPVYLAKGLEFDAVAIYDCGKDSYRLKLPDSFTCQVDDYARHLLYVACTRALHELRLYCVGEPSGILKEIDQRLYVLRRDDDGDDDGQSESDEDE